MIRHIAGGKDLPDEVLEQIVKKTDGVPLFVEELTKMVLESGLLRENEEDYELAGPLPPLAIPATLQDSLMARLDRLTSAKETVQLSAILGRDLTYEMLRAVSSLDEDTLQQGLSRLVEAEMLYTTQGDLYLQARADSGDGLPVTAERHASAVPPAYSRVAGRGVC
jgi:predicted ATPase